MVLHFPCPSFSSRKDIPIFQTFPAPMVTTRSPGEVSPRRKPTTSSEPGRYRQFFGPRFATASARGLAWTPARGCSLAEVKKRFFREAEAAGKLAHPNIVTIYDVGEDYEIAYMAMELLDGSDLEKNGSKGSLLPRREVLRIVSAVASALDYAHANGVVHRDIKPANIMILKNGEVKVADFGIARVMASSKTQTGV
ncbi:MAG TPA: serine/threonine-protein kinase, partial [Syntrophales bacterium]|nr:serine/threonine-protein kinase [Syntrophales bacterium]